MRNTGVAEPAVLKQKKKEKRSVIIIILTLVIIARTENRMDFLVKLMSIPPSREEFQESLIAKIYF